MYTIPFFYKTKLLMSDGQAHQLDNPTDALLKIINEYGLTAEEYKNNHIAFTFGLSLGSRINNGTNGEIKIITEGKCTYAEIRIYNIGYSMIIYFSFGLILFLSQNLIATLFLTSLPMLFLSIQFYLFVNRFIKDCKNYNRRNGCNNEMKINAE